jgi:hypothetical protein
MRHCKSRAFLPPKQGDALSTGRMRSYLTLGQRKVNEKMIFPEDQIRNFRRAEEHSLLSVVIVSIAMIGAALLSMSVFMA